jgi:hypothetical protein
MSAVEEDFEENAHRFEESLSCWLKQHGAAWMDIECGYVVLGFDEFIQLVRASKLPFVKDLRAAILQTERDGVLGKSLNKEN